MPRIRKRSLQDDSNLYPPPMPDWLLIFLLIVAVVVVLALIFVPGAEDPRMP